MLFFSFMSVRISSVFGNVHFFLNHKISADQSVICKIPTYGPTYDTDFLVTCSTHIKVQSILFAVHYYFLSLVNLNRTSS